MIYFFEDVVVGWKHEFGDHEVSRDEVVAFAEKFDPQPFHIDEGAARQSHFGGLVASGWHSCGMAMRMLVDHWHEIPGWQDATMGAFEVDEVRFHAPVRPGDRLHSVWEILEKRESQSNREMGIIKSRHMLYNQAGTKVLSFLSTVAHRRRPHARPN